MRPVAAILTTLGLLVAILVASQVHAAFGSLIVLGTTIWAGIDASKIELRKYKLNGVTSPATTVVACLLLWVIAFPWYLINKGKIARGEAMLKDGGIPSGPRVADPVHSTNPKPDTLAQLEKLAALRQKGMLTEQEFQTQKARLLS